MKYWKNSILTKPFLKMNLPGEVNRDVNFDIYYTSKEIHINNSRIKKKSKWKTDCFMQKTFRDLIWDWNLRKDDHLQDVHDLNLIGTIVHYFVHWIGWLSHSFGLNIIFYMLKFCLRNDLEVVVHFLMYFTTCEVSLL